MEQIKYALEVSSDDVYVYHSQLHVVVSQGLLAENLILMILPGFNDFLKNLVQAFMSLLNLSCL